MNSLIMPLLNILFPKDCQHCGDNFKAGLSNILCLKCFNSLKPYEDPVCDHCGASLPIRAFEDSAIYRCRDCGDEPYYLDQVRAFGVYEGALRIAHHSFKFEGMENFKSEIVGKMMGNTPETFWSGVEALVPIPQSPEKERERGYNPAVLLGEELSKATRISLVNLVEKINPTQPQMSLTREERFKNPKGAYQVGEGVTLPRKLVLVDDVFTTGSTLEECARVLKKAGVEWVGAIVFGRTPRHF